MACEATTAARTEMMIDGQYMLGGAVLKKGLEYALGLSLI